MVSSALIQKWSDWSSKARIIDINSAPSCSAISSESLFKSFVGLARWPNGWSTCYTNLTACIPSLGPAWRGNDRPNSSMLSSDFYIHAMVHTCTHITHACTYIHTHHTRKHPASQTHIHSTHTHTHITHASQYIHIIMHICIHIIHTNV